MDREALEAIRALTLDIEAMDEPDHSNRPADIEFVLQELDALTLARDESGSALPVNALTEDELQALEAELPHDEGQAAEGDSRALEAALTRAEAYAEQPVTGDLILSPDLTLNSLKNLWPVIGPDSDVSFAEAKRLILQRQIAEADAEKPKPVAPAPEAPLAEHIAQYRAMEAWRQRKEKGDPSAQLKKQLARLEARKIKDRERKRLKARKATSIGDIARARLSALKAAISTGKLGRRASRLKGREAFHARVWAIREALRRQTGREPSLSEIGLTVSRYYPEPINKPQVQRSLTTIASLEELGVWK